MHLRKFRRCICSGWSGAPAAPAGPAGPACAILLIDVQKGNGGIARISLVGGIVRLDDFDLQAHFIQELSYV